MEFSHIADSNVWPVWKIVWQCLIKLNTYLLHDPAIPLITIDPKEIKFIFTQSLYINVYSSSINNFQKLEGNQIVLQWIHTLWYIHAMEYYLAIKNELLIHTNWMILKGIIINERRQSERVAYYMIPFTGHSWKDKTIIRENKLVTARSYGWDQVTVEGYSSREFWGGRKGSCSTSWL